MYIWDLWSGSLNLSANADSYLTSLIFMLTPSGIEVRRFLVNFVNIMDVDALVMLVTRASTAMILTTKDKDCSMENDFNYLWHLNVKNWWKM